LALGGQVTGDLSVCASAEDLANITLPEPDDSLGDGELVSPVVVITLTDPTTGQPVTTFAPGQEIEFDLPIDEDTQADLATRIVRSRASACSSVQLMCEYWDEARLRWDSDGCGPALLAPGAGGAADAARCRCNHLTPFALVLRSQVDASATCAASPLGWALALLYAGVMLAAARQLVRINKLPRRVGAPGSAGRLPRLEHVAVAACCALRMVGLLASNALAGRPGALLLLFLLATATQTGVFGVQALRWGALGLFPMHRAAQKRMETVARAAMAGFALSCLVLPLVIMGVQPSSAAMVAKAAAYVLGCCSCLFAILLGLAGGSLLRQLRKMRSSSAVITATHRGTYSAAGRRLLLFTIAFASCFFLQVGTD